MAKSTSTTQAPWERLVLIVKRSGIWKAVPPKVKALQSVSFTAPRHPARLYFKNIAVFGIQTQDVGRQPVTLKFVGKPGESTGYLISNRLSQRSDDKNPSEPIDDPFVITIGSSFKKKVIRRKKTGNAAIAAKA